MAPAKAELRLAPKAREDLEEVWLYSLARWGTPQAKRYIDGLTNAFNFLAGSPKAGMSCDHIREGYRRYPVVRHVVYYRETVYGIEIMRVLHDRRSVSRLFTSSHNFCWPVILNCFQLEGRKPAQAFRFLNQNSSAE